MDISQLRDKKISVIGAARSGVAVAKLLQSQGSLVFVSDKTGPEKLKTEAQMLRELGIAYELGPNRYVQERLGKGDNTDRIQVFFSGYQG